MKEPSRRTSRQFLALGVGAALALGGGGFVLGRATSPRPPAPVPALPSSVPLPAPAATEAPKRLLERADLIALATAAADALAAGKAVPQSVLDAEGRPFELRLPFGCNGPAAEGADAGAWWRYDEGVLALRLHAEPLTLDPGDWLPASSQSVETIEGFWIPRP